MNNKLLYTAFVTLILLTFCNQENDENQRIFDEFKSKISKKILNNFPQNIINTSTQIFSQYPEALKHNQNYCGIFIVNKLNATEFKDEYEKILKDSLIVGQLAENQIVKINSQDVEFPFTESDSSSEIKLYFVPDIHEKYSPISDIILSEKIETFLIDTEYGKFLPEEFMFDKKSIYNEYKHGFSKGMLIDKMERLVIYWLIIW